jgi:hypothetical protein
MKDGMPESFRVVTRSTEQEIQKLHEDCKKVSAEIFRRMSLSNDPRPITNPVKVYIGSFRSNEDEKSSNVIINVNSSPQVAEEARLKLESMGYKTEQII